PPIAQSVVLLRIQAAASYYSTNRTLMEIPELVDVDITPSGVSPRLNSSSFDDLPAELLLILYDYVGLEQFVNLALVIHPTLLRHTMVPELSHKTYDRITSGGHHLPLATRFDSCSAVSKMPVELWLQIADCLEPANSIGLVFALGPQFWQYPGRPSKELATWLRIWSRRARK
ncbi:hypothetical protein GQ44DRAFT_632396, partial [Phaeosphaeriaceae sp. PMI808]